MAEYFTKDGDDYVKVEETLLAQSSVNGIVEKRLEQQKRNEFADYDELKEKAGKVDTINKDWEDKLKVAGDEKSAIEKERDDAKIGIVKIKAQHQFKLSDDLSEFLTGTDEKTILSQAEKLSKGVPGASVNIDKNGKPGDDKKSSDIKTTTNQLFGKKSDD